MYGYIGNAGGFSEPILVPGGSGYSVFDSGEADDENDRANIKKGYGMYEDVRRDYCYVHTVRIES